jgi:hypothetical protein
VDQDHSRKKRVLHEAHVKVDAPFHDAFTPSEQVIVPKKAPPRKVDVPAIAKAG